MVWSGSEWLLGRAYGESSYDDRKRRSPGDGGRMAEEM
jgi:hypothetical protein